MSQLIWLIIFLLFSSIGFCKPLPYDLESLCQPFVLETRKIEIPGYPLAFNPGIVRWNGRLVMSFRILPDPKQSWNSEIGLVFLNEDFEPCSKPQLISLRDEYSIAPSRAEDARLITLGDRLFMAYDDNVELMISKGGFRMFIAEIHYDGEHFIADPVEILKYYEGESRQLREKAWTPFDYRGNMLLAYSINPLLIFHPRLDGSGICDTVSYSKSSVPWKWGIIRGGTPALLDEGGYLAFFHSSIDMASAHSEGKTITHYFVGAYLFSSEPPFTLLKISPEPIVGKYFYKGKHYKPYWKPIRCVFPCGYITTITHIWMVYGRDDHECWIAKIDKAGLLQSLINVEASF